MADPWTLEDLGLLEVNSKCLTCAECVAVCTPILFFCAFQAEETWPSAVWSWGCKLEVLIESCVVYVCVCVRVRVRVRVCVAFGSGVQLSPPASDSPNAVLVIFFTPPLHLPLPPLSLVPLDDCHLMFGRGQPDAASRPHRSVEDGSPLGTDRGENDVSIGWARSFSFAGTVVIVGFLLVFLRSILVPLVVALFLAYLVRPLAESISTCRCIPYFRKRQEAKRREEERGDEEKEPLLSGGVPPSERLVNDSRQLIGRVETLLPRWVGVILGGPRTGTRRDRVLN